jgi:indole-3-glycerol phosphate synthase
MAVSLDLILDSTRRGLQSLRERRGDLEREAGSRPAPASLSQALRGDRVAVVAEVKRRSPSKGDLYPGLDPAALAKEYADGGAACLSVLTDQAYFGGSPDDLQNARAAVSLPVLRKDFTVGASDVCDARIMGADAVLLIVAALDDAALAELHALALAIGLDALGEVHAEAELERALAIGAGLVGVNQRDLITFKVDHERARRVAAAMPDAVVKVAESGVRNAADAAALSDAGYDAVLVGESLVTSKDKGAAVAALRGAEPAPG